MKKIIFLFFVLSCLLGIHGTVNAYIEEVQVSSGPDDAEESSAGVMYLNSNDLELTEDPIIVGSAQTVGIRFNGLNIPQGAAITNAYIQFQVAEISTTATDLNIQAEATNSASVFSNSSGDITGRVWTASEVPWMPLSWLTVGESGPDQQTPDISAVIQEIIDRPAWSSGNSLVLIITGSGKRIAESFDGAPDGASLLHVEYSVNQSPHVGAGADQILILPDNSLALAGTVSDDGLPTSGNLIVTWNQLAGPGTVTFVDAGSAATVADFDLPGTYILQLEAGDGERTATDRVTITIVDSTALQRLTYFASPDGSGSTCSYSLPCQISSFWEKATPGDILYLLDGIYRGSSSMIHPPLGLNGEPGKPIAVKALNDGKVELDGQDINRPVHLDNNDYFILEGFDAHNSGEDAVVDINQDADFNIIRRIVAWDGQQGVNNSNAFATHYNRGNVFEDVAGWGRGRKVYTNSQEGNHVTFRRCWGMWEEHDFEGPKMTMSFAYNSYYALVENCIMTWNRDPGLDLYDLDQPYGLIAVDHNDGDQNVHSQILGSIVYSTSDQNFETGYTADCCSSSGYLNNVEGGYHSGLDSVKIKDSISYLEHPDITTAQLYGNNNQADRLTLIGEKGSKIISGWATGDIYESTDASALVANGGNILQPLINGITTGATIMKRYINSQLTDEELWPWPMNERIRIASCIDKEGLSRSECEERTDLGMDVTKSIFELGGGTMPAFPDLSLTLDALQSPTAATGQTITGTVVAGATVEVITDTAASDGVAVVTDTTWSYSITGLVEGVNVITVTATDGAGNRGAVTTNIVVDTEEPLEPIVSGTTPTNNVMPTWDWVSGGGGNGTYRYKLDDSDLTSAAIETIETSYSPVTVLAEGAHTLYVQERDDVGNWSASGSMAIVVDITPPSLSINAVISPTEFSSQSISGTVEVGATVEVITDTTASDGVAVVTGTTWNYTVTGLVSGANEITVAATDAVGNAIAVTSSITLDTALPALSDFATWVDGTHVDVSYSEAVNGADSPSNYSADNSLSISAVTDLGGDIYRLTTSQQQIGVGYTIIVSGITDGVGNAIDPANDRVTFTRTFNSAPTVPSINSPADRSEVTSTTPVLTVNKSTDGDGDSVTYLFEVSTLNDFSTVIDSVSGITDNGTTASWTTSALADNTIHYWRTMATDGNLNSIYMTTGEFFVNTANDTPTTPAISAPADASEVTSLMPTLSVTNASDLDNDNLTYDFEVDIVDTFDSGSNQTSGAVAEGSSGTTSWIPATLSDNTNWYWKVMARDEHGAYSGEVSGSFFVNISNDAPTAPVVNSPADGGEVTTKTPVLAVDNATDLDGDSLSYTFETDTVDTFSSGAKQTSGSVTEGSGITSWTPAALSDNTTWYWRVKANDGPTDGAYMSASFFVNTANDSPSTPTLNNPADGAEVTTLTPNLVVNASSDIDNDYITYEYEVYDDAGLTSLVTDAIGHGTVWTVSPALTDKFNYWWHARAEDEHGANSGWMTAKSFFVNIVNNKPSAPAITSPSNGDEVASQTPSLNVSNATDIEGDSLSYDFEVYSDYGLTNLVAYAYGVTEGASNTSWTVGNTLTTDTIYYWRVRSYDGTDYGSWTATSTFVVTSGTIPGDIDYNGMADGYDLVLLAISFGKSSGDAGFNPFADLNDDGVVDGDDLAVLAPSFGQYRW